MKKLFLTLLIMAWLAIPAMAEDTYIEDNSDSSDNSTSYIIDLGDGQGSIIIFGDNNTVYLPPAKEVVEPNPNEITIAGNRINLVLTDTDLIIDGIKTRYSRLVFVLTDTWELVWYEQ